MNINFKVIGLTRLGIKPKSTARDANTLTTRPSELFENTAIDIKAENRSVYNAVCPKLSLTSCESSSPSFDFSLSGTVCYKQQSLDNILKKTN